MKDLLLAQSYPPELVIQNGKLLTSGGLFNLVYLLLFTPASWINDFLQHSCDSKIPEMMRTTLTNQIRLDVIAEANRVLSCLVPDIADSIVSSATIPKSGWLYLAIEVRQPDNILEYHLNWGEM